MTTTPKTFSIITPVRNGQKYISNAYHSLVGQDVSLEWVIQDGASTDGTLKKLANFADIDIDLVSTPDKGQGSAINFALQRCSGQYVGWLNSDEMYLPWTLKTIENYFSNHPEADVVFGDVVFCDATLKFIRLLGFYSFSRLILKYRGCSISTVSMFVRRERISAIELQEDLHTLLDWDLFLTLSENNLAFRWIPIPLGVFTVHENQITTARLPRNSEQHKYVRRRHHIRDSMLLRLIGDILHLYRKVKSRSTKREIAAKDLKGWIILMPDKWNSTFLTEIQNIYGTSSSVQS